MSECMERRERDRRLEKTPPKPRLENFYKKKDFPDFSSNLQFNFSKILCWIFAKTKLLHFWIEKIIFKKFFLSICCI